MNPRIVALVAQHGAIPEETFQAELSTLTAGYHADIARVHVLWAEGMIDAREFADRHDSLMAELRANEIRPAVKVAPLAAFARVLTRAEAREAEDKLRQEAIDRTREHRATIAAERVALGGIVAPTAQGGFTRSLGVKPKGTPAKPLLAPVPARQSPILDPSTPALIAARNAAEESAIKDAFVRGEIPLNEARQKIKVIRAFTADSAKVCHYCAGDSVLRRVCQPCGASGRLILDPPDVPSPMIDVRPVGMFAFTVTFENSGMDPETYDAATGHEAVRRMVGMLSSTAGMNRAKLQTGVILTLREKDEKGNLKTSRMFFEESKDADKALDKALQPDGWKRTLPMPHAPCHGKGCEGCGGKGRTFMSVIHKIADESDGWITDTVYKSDLRQESRAPAADQPVAPRHKDQWVNRGAAHRAAASDRKHVEKTNSKTGMINYTANSGGVIMRAGFIPEQADAVKYRWNAIKASRKASR